MIFAYILATLVIFKFKHDAIFSYLPNLTITERHVAMTKFTSILC